MKLYLMRHCEPTRGLPMDGTRSLVADGVKQAEDMAAWLAREIGRVDYVVSSDFARAAETAAIMGKTLGASVVAQTAMLQPDKSPAQAWDDVMRLAMQSKTVLVVTHDPLINSLLFWLMGIEDGSVEEVRFDWGSIAYLKGDAESMRLFWFVTPSLVLADREIIDAAEGLAASLAGT